MMLSLASFHDFSYTSDLRGSLFNFLCLNNSINLTIIVYVLPHVSIPILPNAMSTAMRKVAPVTSLNMKLE